VAGEPKTSITADRVNILFFIILIALVHNQNYEGCRGGR
jgi:hypothetical protein